MGARIRSCKRARNGHDLFAVMKTGRMLCEESRRDVWLLHHGPPVSLQQC